MCCSLGEETRVTYLIFSLLPHILQALCAEPYSFYFTHIQRQNQKVSKFQTFSCLVLSRLYLYFIPYLNRLIILFWVMWEGREGCMNNWKHFKSSVLNSFSKNKGFGTYCSMLNRTLFQTLFYSQLYQLHNK